MAEQGEVIYSDQGRMNGMVLCGACKWARPGQADPQATAEEHNSEKHGGSLTVNRVESAVA